MKWLIVGTGSISIQFIEALRNNNEIPYGVYSRTIEKGEAFAKENKIPHVITSLEDVSSYDIAYIASPNSIHYGQAKTIIAQGKDVLIEKPMTHSLELSKELFELGKKHNVKVMEAYAHITNQEMQELKGKYLKTNFMRRSSHIDKGDIDNASSFNKELFGGVIPDLGVYPIALAILLLGNVIDYKILNKEYLNDVIISCDIRLVHERGRSEFSLSKLKNGDNAVYLDGKKVFENVSCGHMKNKMNAEVKEFIDGKNLDLYKKNIIRNGKGCRTVNEIIFSMLSFN